LQRNRRDERDSPRNQTKKRKYKMPTRPVEVGNRLAEGQDIFRVVATPGTQPGTFHLAYGYHLIALLQSASWEGAVIDTLECLVLPASIPEENGVTLPSNARILATQTATVASVGQYDFATSGSVVLPASYFGFVSMPFVDSHRTWTLLVRTHGCRSVNGTIGASEVLSCLALHADVKGLPVPVVMEPPLP
jgi:hypothetical protein